MPALSQKAFWLFGLTLIVVVFLVYQPAWNGGFVWDDDLHLLNNPVLRPGGLARIWVPGSIRQLLAADRPRPIGCNSRFGVSIRWVFTW